MRAWPAVAILVASAALRWPPVCQASALTNALPVVVRPVAPEYPPWARGSGISTVVKLNVLVTADGRVSRVRGAPYTVRDDILSRRLRASFDSAAVRAVLGWTFRPAEEAGRSVAAWAAVEVPFDDPSNPRLRTATETETRCGLPPRVIRRVAPLYPREARGSCLEGEVWLSLHLNDLAVPERVAVAAAFQVPKPYPAELGARFDSAAVHAARSWQYAWQQGDTLRNCRIATVSFLFMSDDSNTCDRGVKHRITGFVSDAATGEPIEMATLIALGTRVGTQTDSMGRFRLVGAPEGICKILITGLGYERSWARVRVERGAGVRLDAALEPSPPRGRR